MKRWLRLRPGLGMGQRCASHVMSHWKTLECPGGVGVVKIN